MHTKIVAHAKETCVTSLYRSEICSALQLQSSSNQSTSYPLEQLESTNQRPDLAPAQQRLPQDGEIVEVPHVMGGALGDVGGGFLSDIISDRRQDPHAETRQQLGGLSIKPHTHTHTHRDTHTHARTHTRTHTHAHTHTHARTHTHTQRRTHTRTHVGFSKLWGLSINFY